MPSKITATSFLAFALAGILSGCATIEAGIEGSSFPQDTAVLVNGVPYQINMEKCAEIRSVDENGDLNCYDYAGNKSARISPVSEFRVSVLKDKMGMEWATPEHQIFLFNFYHRGGVERSVAAIRDGFQAAKGINDYSKMVDDHFAKMDELRSRGGKVMHRVLSERMAGNKDPFLAHKIRREMWFQENLNFAPKLN